MDTGFMIAALIIGLYVCLGPLVFLFLYIVFDRLAELEPEPRPQKESLPVDTALWSPSHIQAFLDHRAWRP
jgi:hypothetical protein